MKRSGIIICFSVFAATIMLMTTCIAQPVQQSVSIEAVESTAVESTQQELISSVEAIALKMKNDPLINSFVGKILSDTTLNSLASTIVNTHDPNKQMSLVNSLKAYISSKYSIDINSLKAYISSKYSIDIQKIGAGTINSAKPTWSGFMCSTNGSIYVPGVGWVSPTDPYYNYWLSLEHYLQGSDAYPPPYDLQDWFVFILTFIAFFTPPGYITEVVISDLWVLFLFITTGAIIFPFTWPVYILILLSIFVVAPLWLDGWYIIFKYGWPSDFPQLLMLN